MKSDIPKIIKEPCDDLAEHGVRVTRVRFDSDDLPYQGFTYQVDLFLLFDLNDFTINIVYSQVQLFDALLDSCSFKFIRSGVSFTEEEYNVFKSHFNKER